MDVNLVKQLQLPWDINNKTVGKTYGFSSNTVLDTI